MHRKRHGTSEVSCVHPPIPPFLQTVTADGGISSCHLQTVKMEAKLVNLPEEHTVDRLIGLIKERGRWYELM